MLFLFPDVGADDAPTPIRAGSHTIIARRLPPYGESGLSLRELPADGYAATSGCEEVLATGDAGTVYLCLPFLVHATEPHCGTRPRFMALANALADFGSKVRSAIEQAGKLGDADTSDLFTEVSRDVDKNLWLLETHLQAER